MIRCQILRLSFQSKSIFFTLSVFASFGSLASESKSLTEAQVVQVPVPQTQLYLPDLVPPTSRSVTQIDLSASTWQQETVDQSTVIADSTPFIGGSISRFNVGLTNSLWAFEKLHVSPKVGASFTQLLRRGSVALPGEQRFGVTETLNIYSFRMGFEVSNKILPRSGFLVYASAMLLPSWMQSPATAFNRKGMSQTTIAGEIGGGVGYFSEDVSRLLGVETAGLTLGAEATGGLGETALRGYGLTLGTRLGI